MSKMSQLHAELSEQAYEMGYLTLDQALADGCEIDYRISKLTKPVDGREQAHEDYIKRKEEVLTDLKKLKQDLEKKGEENQAKILTKAIDIMNEKEI